MRYKDTLKVFNDIYNFSPNLHKRIIQYQQGFDNDVKNLIDQLNRP
jgi:hypothetical protein